MQLHFRRDDEDLMVAVTADGPDWRLQVGTRDIPLQATADSDGSWRVQTHQGQRRLWVAVRGDERLVFCDGKVHTLRLATADGDDDQGPEPGGPNLTADMPGKVVQVAVAVGQQVTVGQTLVIMESMKMETELSAGVAGTVATVHVVAGDVVARGAPLVDVDAGPGPAADPGVDGAAAGGRP